MAETIDNTLPPLPQTEKILTREAKEHNTLDAIKANTQKESRALQAELPHNPDLQVISRLVEQLTTTSATEPLSVEQKNIIALLETYTDSTSRKTMLTQGLNTTMIEGKSLHAFLTQTDPAHAETLLSSSPRNAAIVSLYLHQYEKTVSTVDLSTQITNYRAYVEQQKNTKNTVAKRGIENDLINPLVLIEHLKDHPGDHLLEDSVEQYILALPVEHRQESLKSYATYLLQHSTCNAQILRTISKIQPAHEQITLINQRTGDNARFNQDHFPHPALFSEWAEWLDLTHMPYKTTDGSPCIEDALYTFQSNLFNGKWNAPLSFWPEKESAQLSKLLPTQSARYQYASAQLGEAIKQENTLRNESNRQKITWLLFWNQGEAISGRELMLKTMYKKMGEALTTKYEQAGEGEKEQCKQDILSFGRMITHENRPYKDYLTASTTIMHVLLDRININDTLNTLCTDNTLLAPFAQQCHAPDAWQTQTADALFAPCKNPLTQLVVQQYVPWWDKTTPIASLAPMQQASLLALYDALQNKENTTPDLITSQYETRLAEFWQTMGKMVEKNPAFWTQIEQQLAGLSGIDAALLQQSNEYLAHYDIQQMGPLESGFGSSLLKGLKFVGRGWWKALTFVPRIIKGATSRTAFFIGWLLIGGGLWSYLTYKLMWPLHPKAEIVPTTPLTKEQLIGVFDIRTTVQGYKQTIAPKYEYFHRPEESDDWSLTKLAKEAFNSSFKDEFHVTTKGYLEAFYDLKQGPFEIIDNPDQKSITISMPPVKITPAITDIDVDITSTGLGSRLLPSSLQPEARNKLVQEAVQQTRKNALENIDWSLEALIVNSEKEASTFWINILSTLKGYPKENISVHFDNKEETIIIMDPTKRDEEIKVDIHKNRD